MFKELKRNLKMIWIIVIAMTVGCGVYFYRNQNTELLGKSSSTGPQITNKSKVPKPNIVRKSIAREIPKQALIPIESSTQLKSIKGKVANPEKCLNDMTDLSSLDLERFIEQFKLKQDGFEGDCQDWQKKVLGFSYSECESDGNCFILMARYRARMIDFLTQNIPVKELSDDILMNLLFSNTFRKMDPDDFSVRTGEVGDAILERGIDAPPLYVSRMLSLALHEQNIDTNEEWKKYEEKLKNIGPEWANQVLTLKIIFYKKTMNIEAIKANIESMNSEGLCTAGFIDYTKAYVARNIEHNLPTAREFLLKAIQKESENSFYQEGIESLQKGEELSLPVNLSFSL